MSERTSYREAKTLAAHFKPPDVEELLILDTAKFKLGDLVRIRREYFEEVIGFGNGHDDLMELRGWVKTVQVENGILVYDVDWNNLVGNPTQEGHYTLELCSGIERAIERLKPKEKL